MGKESTFNWIYTPTKTYRSLSSHSLTHSLPPFNLFGNSSSGGLSLKDLLDNLLFFNKEGTDDAVADTARAAASTVGTADSFGVLAHSVVFSGAQSGDL